MDSLPKKAWKSWQNKAKELYQALFINFKGYSHYSWGEDQENVLVEMEDLKQKAEESIDDTSYSREVFDKIALFTKKAKTLKEGFGQVNQLQTLYQRVVVGLKQDPKFSRVPEYYQEIHLLGNKIKELKGESKKVYGAARDIFDQCVTKLQTCQKQAEIDIFNMRIERADDLLYVCNRSDPIDYVEHKKKIAALKEVYNDYLIPLQKENMPEHLHTFLQRVIGSYRDTLTKLENFTLTSVKR